MPGGIALKFGSEKVSRYTGVSQLQLRVSRYTVQLNFERTTSDFGADWGRGRFYFDSGFFIRSWCQDPNFGDRHLWKTVSLDRKKPKTAVYTEKTMKKRGLGTRC